MILFCNFLGNSLGAIIKNLLVSDFRTYVCWFVHFCNSSGTFISASEDKTGILELIEHKIARATMLPQTHGEV